MDVTRLLTHKIHLSGFIITGERASVILASVLIAGCFGSRPANIHPPAAQSLVKVEERVAKIRGLQFKRQVTFSDKAADPNTDAAEEYGPQAITHIERVYKRLGVLPESVDFRKALLEFSKLQRMIDYDAPRATAVVTPDAAKLGQALAGGPTERAAPVPAVLALAQALQEQHFRWQEKLRAIGVEDRKVAFRALAYGDAVLVGSQFLSGNARADDFTDQLKAIGRLGSELEKMGSSLPPMLREKLVFPYREGSRFVQWAYAAKGWDGVNALFSDPPLSSAQILHPEKYYASRKNPVRILPFGLFREMKESSVVDQTVGEWFIRVLLASSRPHQEAAQIAAGWAGDHLSAYPDRENLVTAWISAWSDSRTAQSFRQAYQTVLERRHRLRFETAAREQDGIKADLRTGRSVVLQVRGSFVLLLDGIATARALEVSESVWKDLEIGTESTVIFFDSAAGPVQFNSR